MPQSYKLRMIRLDLREVKSERFASRLVAASVRLDCNEYAHRFAQAFWDRHTSGSSVYLSRCPR